MKTKVLDRKGRVIEVPAKFVKDLAVGDEILTNYDYTLKVEKIATEGEMMILEVEHDITEDEYHFGERTHVVKYHRENIVAIKS